MGMSMCTKDGSAQLREHAGFWENELTSPAGVNDTTKFGLVQPLCTEPTPYITVNPISHLR